MWNPKLDVYRTEWLDLVFENRNKSYGAYELRQHNNQTTVKALLMASALMVSVIIALFIYSKRNTMAAIPDVAPVNEIVLTLSKVTEHKVPRQQPLKVEPARPEKPVSVNAKKFVNLKVVSAANVFEEPASIEELQTSLIGSINTDGVLNGAQPTETSEGSGNGTGNLPAAAGDEIVSVDFLEKYPEFPGGERAFAKYLSRNLRYPYMAVESNITGRVWVSFIVEKNGSLSDIKVVRGIGGGCDEEAVRVLKKAPAWSPGMQNGRFVRVAYTIPIHFQLNN